MTNTRKLAVVAVLSALSFLLMLYEIPLITEFLKLDFSIIPILLALVVLDFKSSMAVLLIRSALKLALNNHGIGTLIGLPMNILAVTVFVSAFALLWRKRKSLSGGNAWSNRYYDRFKCHLCSSALCEIC